MRLLDADQALSAATDALSRGVRVTTLELAALRDNFRAVNAELRESALRRCEEDYISNAGGSSPCWKLLKFLSRDVAAPNIPPEDITRHFKEVYYKRDLPACLRLIWFTS